MSDRYQHEIDELLHRLEGRLRREPLSSKMSRRLRPYSHGLRGAFGAFLRRPPAEQFMIAAMALVVISFVLSSFLGQAKLAFYLSVLSLLLFVLGIGMSIAGRQSPGYRRRWRGRELEYETYGPSIWSHLRNWLRRRRR